MQALDARDTAARHSLRISLLAHLLTRVRWVLGTGMTALGWPLQILALSYVPLVVVQPTLACGLLVLLLAGERLLGEPPGRRELLAVGAIIAGVAGIAALAPRQDTHHVHGIAIVLVLTLLGIAASTPFILQLLGRPLATATMVGAGLAFAWSGLVNQFVADAGKNGHWGTAVAWAAGAAAAAVVGLTCEMSALQRRPAILVAPVVFVVQTVVPIGLAPLVLHSSFLRLAGVRHPAARVPARGARRRDDDRALAGAACDQRRPRSAGQSRERQADQPVAVKRVRQPVDRGERRPRGAE